MPTQYTHAHRHICTHIHICTHTYVHRHMYTQTQMYTDTCVHTYIHFVCVCVCVRTFIYLLERCGSQLWRSFFAVSWKILPHLRQSPKDAFAFAITGDLLPLSSFLCYIFLALKLMRYILLPVSKHLKKILYILSFVSQSYFRPISVLLDYTVWCGTLLFCSLFQLSFLAF